MDYSFIIVCYTFLVLLIYLYYFSLSFCFLLEMVFPRYSYTCMIYLHNTFYTVRFTVLLVIAMRKKAKKYFLISTFLLFYIIQHYIKEKFLFFKFHFEA
jgi:hypothetical protein